MSRLGNEGGAYVDQIVEILKAAGESTRLRILALLARGELAAGELSTVLGQSQPRVSRHLKLLVEAGLVERRPEGAWVFFKLTNDSPASRIARAILDEAGNDDDSRDFDRLAQIHAARESQAQAYFEAAAGEWEVLRRLHQPEAAVEAALVEAAGTHSYGLHLDLGSGTGRLLELFAPLTRRGEGIDTSRKMLALARARLDAMANSNFSVRQADILALPHAAGSADLVTLHQVLHYLPEPSLAVAEAARVLAPGGLLLIADFAPHGFEELREKHAHRRLGFETAEVSGWCKKAGLVGVATRAIQAQGDADGLAVTLWSARKPAADQSNRSAA
jgi:SAM-dependent methyltransferase